jgi:hypothetical protein
LGPGWKPLCQGLLGTKGGQKRDKRSPICHSSAPRLLGSEGKEFMVPVGAEPLSPFYRWANRDIRRKRMEFNTYLISYKHSINV